MAPADSGNVVLGSGGPTGDIAVHRYLERTQNGGVEMAAAHHGDSD
jgi:hypothetical protein